MDHLEEALLLETLTNLEQLPLILEEGIFRLYLLVKAR